MKSIREQLQRERAGYQAVRYPGDLAADVLPRPAWMRPTRVRWAAAAAALAAALAASLAVVLWLSQPGSDGRATVAVRPPAPIETAAHPSAGQEDEGEETAVPAFPSGVQLLPQYEAFSLPSMPAFPSFDAPLEETDSNPQESV